MKRDTVAKLSVRLETSLGTLKVVSDPPDAGVAVDGKQLGRTPVTRQVEEGDYQLSIRKSGYHAHDKTITIRAKQTTRVIAELTKITTGELQGKTWKDPTTGMEFVWIPQGCFKMGSPQSERDRDDSEGPQHEVCVDGFWMGKYEVTIGEYQKYLNAGAGGTAESFMCRSPDCPVANVTSEDAKAMAEWMSREGGRHFRLPTEAEWEYAARAGTTTAYSFGDDQSRLGEYAWYSDNFGLGAHRVGQKRANRWGLYDVHGNVSEWVADWFGKYSLGRQDNPTGPSSGSLRVYRGGGWNKSARDCRSANRNVEPLGCCEVDLGFRLLRLP